MDPQFIEDVCSTLQAAFTVITSTSTGDTSAAAPSRERVTAVADGLKSEAAKVGFLFSQTEKPSRVAGELLLAGLRDTTATLCLLFAAATAGRGPTLRKSLEKIAGDVVSPVIALIKAAVKASGDATTLPPLAGLVMERCAVAGRAPLDDRTAIGRAMTSVARQIADAAAELSAAAAAQEDEEDDGLALLVAVRAVVEGAGGVVRAAMRVLLTADGGEAWESILFHVNQLSAAVDDAAIAAYSPDEVEEMQGAAAAVLNGCELIADEVDPVSEDVVAAAGRVQQAVEEVGRLLLSTTSQ